MEGQRPSSWISTLQRLWTKYVISPRRGLGSFLTFSNFLLPPPLLPTSLSWSGFSLPAEQHLSPNRRVLFFSLNIFFLNISLHHGICILDRIWLFCFLNLDLVFMGNGLEQTWTGILLAYRRNASLVVATIWMEIPIGFALYLL